MISVVRRPKVRKISRPLKSEQRAAEPSPEVAGTPLAESLKDAELLIRYAGGYGITVEKSILENIASADEALRQGRLTPAHKADFYSSFIALSKAVSPVTVSSLKACIIDHSCPVISSTASIA